MPGLVIHSIRVYVALILIQILYQMAHRNLEFRFQPWLLVAAIGIGFGISFIQKSRAKKKKSGNP